MNLNLIGAFLGACTLAAIFYFAAPAQVSSVAPAQVDRVIPCDPKVGDDLGNDCPCAFRGDCPGYDKHNKPQAKPAVTEPTKEAAKPAAPEVKKPHKPIYRRVLKGGKLDGKIDCSSVPAIAHQFSQAQVIAAAKSYGLSVAQIEKLRVCIQ